MFAFQRIANAFAEFFSLRWLWLTPWNIRDLSDSYLWEEVREADPSRPAPMPFDAWRLVAGFLITASFGVLAGLTMSWLDVRWILLVIPFLGLALFLWGTRVDNDNYSDVIGWSCLFVGAIWGVGAFIGVVLFTPFAP